MDDIRQRVALMRELGIVQMDGITLGPQPTRLQALEAKPQTPQTEQEIAEERRLARIEAEWQRLTDMLGRRPTEGEFQRMHKPENLQ